MKTQEEIEVMLEDMKKKTDSLFDFITTAEKLGCQTLANELNIVRSYYVAQTDLLKEILNISLPF